MWYGIGRFTDAIIGEADSLMSGFFNSFYYGKAGKADFTPDQLPGNRVQLFFEMLRVRFSGIVGMNLLYALFSVPAIVWTWINLMVLNGTVQYDEAGNIISTVALSVAEANSYILIYLVFMIPCFMLAAVGSEVSALCMETAGRGGKTRMNVESIGAL